MSKAKSLLLAVAAAAMAFTFSCSGDDGGGGGDSSSSGDIDGGVSSSSGGGNSSSSSSDIDGGVSSSSGGGNSSSSSSDVDGGVSSSSGGGNSSSSSGDVDGGVSSSSEGGNSSSSSSDVDGSVSSSSEGGNSSSSSSDVDGGVSSSSEGDNVFIDPRDGKTYKFEVAPDGTVWMSENLNYSRDNTLGYCYGVDIDGADPHQDAIGCDNGYGRIYEWATAIDGNSPQGLCPDGWHIPSTEEWNSAIDGKRIIMSPGFYIHPGNYNTNSEYPPLGWKDRDVSGFYWTSSGNTHFTGFWNGPASDYYDYEKGFIILEIQSGASSEDRFSVRCLRD